MAIEKRKLKTPATPEADDRPQSPGRRQLLRKTAVSMPALLTLQSGAALARSSNLIGTAPLGTRDAAGNALCLDTSRARSMGNGQYDLGEPAFGTVNVLPDRVYYPDKNKNSAPRSADMVCATGGTHYYKDRGWQQVNLPYNGALVSATSVASVSARGAVFLNRIS